MTRENTDLQRAHDDLLQIATMEERPFTDAERAQILATASMVRSFIAQTDSLLRWTFWGELASAMLVGIIFCKVFL